MTYKKRAWHAPTLHGRNRSVKTSSIARLALGCLLLSTALLGAGCRREIGDDCQTSVDCDPNGTRACDLSQPGGYCTILGCDEKSCPSGATCIRYFPEAYLSKMCDPACEDVPACKPTAGDGGVGGCSAPPDGGVGSVGCPDCPATCMGGPQDKCNAEELCISSAQGGLCARRALEKRACAKACSSNGDCRDGYECRDSNNTGLGSMVLASDPSVTTKFCAPVPPATPAQ
jgi:hypothetical protein